MTDTRKAIAGSHAGMRFIAQMTFYNQGNFERLGVFIAKGYTPVVLMANPIKRRLLDFKTSYKLNGKLRVKEVEMAEKYHIHVILETEKNDQLLAMELKVEEDYPHRIIHYELKPAT